VQDKDSAQVELFTGEVTALESGIANFMRLLEEEGDHEFEALSHGLV